MNPPTKLEQIDGVVYALDKIQELRNARESVEAGFFEALADDPVWGPKLAEYRSTVQKIDAHIETFSVNASDITMDLGMAEIPSTDGKLLAVRTGTIIEIDDISKVQGLIVRGEGVWEVLTPYIRVVADPTVVI